MRWFIGLGCLLSLFSTLSAQDSKQEKKPEDKSIAQVVGNWEGSLKAGAIELRFGVVIKEDAKGTMFSVDQGNAAIPISKVTLVDKDVKFFLPSILANYTAKLNEAGDEMTGTYQQGTAKFPLKLKKVASLAKINRPQEPKPPFPYKSEEVSYENAAAKVTLSGTLTLPKEDGPHPVVLMITGSGQQDRDESLLGHKPFLVIADYLTRRGIAVLRVDDRGIGKSTGNFGASTTFDFADDVLAGVEYLKTRKEIDPKRIGLIGHSEGGVIAPIVATKSKDVAFIVLLAGTGLPGDEIIYMQGRLIALAGGAKKEHVDHGEEIQRKLFTLVKAEKPSNELVAKLRKLLNEEIAKSSEEEKKELEKEGGKAAIEAQLSSFTSPWFKTFLIHDPRTVLAQVKCPVLALNGELDLQVPCKENLEAIKTALEKAGHRQHTIKALPRLNHLFQTCNTGSPTEYGKIEETINPEVLKTMGDWILALPQQ
ncbi:MAG TPA: alpha/beta fold hydrolase [Gemmatales bacterium]|nr:alpha/beta fold hydrolase [Gemmatales bacterium]